jgi:hypothetical protein
MNPSLALEKNNSEESASHEMKEYFRFGAMGTYVKRIFGKKDPNAPNSFNLRMMHGINRISIILFLVAVIVLVVRRLM